MEPEDTRHSFKNFKIIMPFSSESSDNLRSVQEIQTNRRRRKRAIMSVSTEEHQCSSASFGRSMCPSSTLSSSLVLFLSALLLFVCVAPIQSLPFDGRSLSHSSSNSGSNSHRSHMDLLIDPIHQAEFGDDDPFENTRVVKSVFDMVLRTPPPPTSSSNRCPPGTQSPFEGGPCIKKSTDPVALVDQSFLLDTLRGLAKEGVLLGGPQKSRRPGGGPGNNRRRTSGRPGSRTTTTTTSAPSTTMNSSEEELEGEMSTTFTSSNAATGDINVNMAAVEEEVVAITQEPSTSSSVGSTLSTSESNEETEKPVDENKNEDESLSSASSDQIATSSDTMAPESTTLESPTTPLVVTSSVPSSTTTSASEVSPVKSGADLRRTAASPETEQMASSSTTGNDDGITVPAVTTPITLLETQTTATSIRTTSTSATANEQQVKSGQVHKEEKEEPVPTILMTITPSTPISSMTDQSSANSDAGGSSSLHLNNQDNFQSNTQSDSEISLESQANHKQDDHRSTHDHNSFTSTTPLSPSSFSTATPTFPNEEFVTTVDVTSEAPTDNNPRGREQDSVIVSSNPNSITKSPIISSVIIPASFFEPKLTTVNPPTNPSGAVGAENQIVTGVIPTTVADHPHRPNEHQEIQHADAHSQIEDISLFPEDQAALHEDQQNQEKLREDLMKITTRMMKVSTIEPPLIREEDKINGDESSRTLPPSSSTVSAIPQELKETQTSSSSSPVASEKESKDESKTAPMLLTEEESKVSHAINTAGMNVEIPKEKVLFRPLGPLEKIRPEKTTAVMQEDGQDAMEKAASDMSLTRKDEQQVTRVNETKTEQGDGQPSSTINNDAVNHLKDGDDDKGKGTVTPQVEDVDLPIINVNPPSSVSPVHDSLVHHHNEQSEMPVKDETVVVLVQKDRQEIIPTSDYMIKESNLREEEQPHNFSGETARDEPVSNGKNESPVETTLVLPPATSTTAPDTHQLHKFQPGDTLLQFQLPIVTRTPTTSKKQENVESNSFQTFPEFPSVTDTGKVRFPHSGEDNRGAPKQAPFKPIFVQDFHLDYPPSRDEQPPSQQWQVPLPFHAPQTSSAPYQQQLQTQTQAPILPEYYDTGSTEYLESELDRRHQKARSRNRIRNSQEPAIPSTTNQPLLPQELLHYPTPQQHQSPPSPHPQQHNHHQPSLYFARRNPASDLIPFGYLNFRTGHERFHHNNRRLIW